MGARSSRPAPTAPSRSGTSATRKQIGSPLPVGQGWVFAAFSDDGSTVLGASNGGRAVAWSVDPDEWKARACALAGRTLTRAEWAAFLPERPYSPACR